MNGHLKAPIHAGWAWQFHWLNLSSADIFVVVAMLVVFALALVLPFPREVEK